VNEAFEKDSVQKVTLHQRRQEAADNNPGYGLRTTTQSFTITEQLVPMILHKENSPLKQRTKDHSSRFY
jgi:hypothetical protein